VPSGALHEDVTNVIGMGCAVSPVSVQNELADVERYTGQTFRDNRLMVSPRAHLITPLHALADSSGSGVGSTKQGVGPVYTDKVARKGIRIADLEDKDLVRWA
jgi:adenylosuccinate synthase